MVLLTTYIDDFADVQRYQKYTDHIGLQFQNLQILEIVAQSPYGALCDLVLKTIDLVLTSFRPGFDLFLTG